MVSKAGVGELWISQKWLSYETKKTYCKNNFPWFYSDFQFTLLDTERTMEEIIYG